MPKGVAQAKRRLDLLLVERGLATSSEQAQALIMAGRVTCDDQPADKPGTRVPALSRLAVAEPFPYVSRGGTKLAHALDVFDLDVAGRVCLDVGASTGGFTDCLLQRGACRVYALDVGYGQLAYRLRQDPRVVAQERVNAHFPFSLPEPVHLATVDVSFISLTQVLPNVAPQVAPGGFLAPLVKPQFEAHRDEVGRGGVVRDPRVQAAALGRIIAWAVQRGLRLRHLAASPITGDAGNREFFLLLQTGPA